MNDTFTSIHVTGQHKNKQISDRLEYILPICINTHGQYTTPTCPKCAYKISQIFSRVFEFALAEKPRNPRKLMYREYFHVYSRIMRRKKKCTHTHTHTHTCKCCQTRTLIFDSLNEDACVRRTTGKLCTLCV